MKWHQYTYYYYFFKYEKSTPAFVFLEGDLDKIKIMLSRPLNRSLRSSQKKKNFEMFNFF